MATAAPARNGGPASPDEGGDGNGRSLGRTHAESFVVGLAATGLTALQNLVVVLLLSRRELGLLGIASGIGAVVLVAQHFGVGPATVKEVAIARTRATAFEVMVAAAGMRVALTAPIALALVAASGWLAEDVYRQPEIRTPLLLFAAVILLYGLTDVFSYTLQGLHLWRRFFAVKLAVAVLHPFPVLVGAVAGGVRGYFIGIAISAAIGMVIALGGAVSVFSRHEWRFPHREIIGHARGMVRLGLYTYLVKVLQALILQGPILVVGYFYAAEITGDVKLALTIGGGLLALSGAVNTINIAVFSRAVSKAAAGVVERTRRQVALYAVASGTAAAAVAPVAPELVDVLGRGQYGGAVSATVIALCACALFGVIGVVTSTVHIPAGEYGRFAALYAIPTLVTVGGAFAASQRTAGVAMLIAPLLAGCALGTAIAFYDLHRRGLLPRFAALGLIGVVGLAGLPDLGLPGFVRFPLALVAAMVGAAALYWLARGGPGRRPLSLPA